MPMLQNATAPEVTKPATTWIVKVEYPSTPVEPYRDADGDQDPRVKFLSSTECGKRQTIITAEVTADSEDEARAIGTAGIAWLARIFRLAGDPVDVIVKP
jgi:hypothetical protein